MTDQQDLRARLPELPEPAHHYNRPHPNGILVNDSVPMFTADQMRAYALEAAAQLGRVGGRASVDEVHAWAERHDITGQYLVAAYEDAAASQLPAGVPDGWKLVPVEPTDDMLEAYQEAMCGLRNMTSVDDNELVILWSAMLAAAPKPDSEESK